MATCHRLKDSRLILQKNIFNYLCLRSSIDLAWFSGPTSHVVDIMNVANSYVKEPGYNRQSVLLITGSRLLSTGIGSTQEPVYQQADMTAQPRSHVGPSK